MTQRTRPKANARIRKTGPAGTSEAGTLSVRRPSDERKLLAEAATLRGWTPTNLLRVAALERAAQILNTSKPNTTDFRRIAERVAQVLCETRRLYRGTDPYDQSPEEVELGE